MDAIILCDFKEVTAVTGEDTPYREYIAYDVVDTGGEMYKASGAWNITMDQPAHHGNFRKRHVVGFIPLEGK